MTREPRGIVPMGCREVSDDGSLGYLLDAPTLALELPPHEAAVLLAKVGALEAILRARLATSTPPGPVDRPHDTPDRLLDAAEVGNRLGFTVKQVYRRAKGWPFTRSEGRRTLRFSETGLCRYLAGKNA